MTKTEIQTLYQYNMTKIEERFSDSAEIPTDVQQYYLACCLIYLASFEAFHQRYGLVAIDKDFAECGKTEWLALNPLTRFESDSVDAWNKFVHEQQSKRNQHSSYNRRLSLISDPRR